MLLSGMADESVLDAAEAVLAACPPRRMVTPGGREMSVAMTNCGPLGWVTDRTGYRYSAADPATGRLWPSLPEAIRSVAVAAAAAAGFADFAPEACLVNLYGPAARMGLHQDRDEADFGQPIVSVSLGRAARFRYGGTSRGGPTRSFLLRHGDVLVFGGPARLVHHGVDGLEGPPHARLGDSRINLTLRRVNPLSRVST